MNIRKGKLDDRSEKKKPHQGENQNFALVLIGNGGRRGCDSQIHDAHEIHCNIDMKEFPAKIAIVRLHAEHGSGRKGHGQKNNVDQPEDGCASPYFLPSALLVQNMDQTQRHRGCQRESEIVCKKIDPPVLHRSLIHNHRNDLQNGDHRDQEIGFEKSSFLAVT